MTRLRRAALLCAASFLLILPAEQLPFSAAAEGTPPAAQQSPKKTKNKNQTEGEKKDLEGPPRTASSKAGLAPCEARPKTKTGNLAVPRFSSFLVAVVAS
jgi:hypothetical protein